MGKRRDNADPIRWRDRPPSRPGDAADVDQAGGNNVGDEIARAARVLASDTATIDDVRLAQIRQRLSAGAGVPAPRAAWMLARRTRLAVVVLASLGVGGVATAVTGRLIERRRAAAGLTKAERPAGSTGRGGHRWRVATKAAAALELSVGPTGTDVVVVEGNAEVSAAGLPGSVHLVPGASWRVPAEAPPAVVDGIGAAPRTTTGAMVAAAAPTIVSRSKPAVARSAVSPGGLARSHARAERVPEEERPVDMGINPRSEPGVDLPRIVLLEPSPLGELKPAPVLSRPGAASSPAAVAPPAPQVSEAALLGRALRQLRADRDAKGALVQLDERDRRFPRGALGREAALARAETLLALERKGQALAVLDGLALSGTAIDRRVLLARAELRVAHGRRADAVADYDAVLSSGRGDEFAARALYGRATLRARAGDVAAAADDLREYLRRFPNGARRREAETLLGRLPDRDR